MNQPEIETTFHENFRLVLADSPELRREVYRIRYEVYCQELHYEDAAEFPEGLEQDSFDARSRHCLLLHRRTNTFAGCIRLVFNDAADPGQLLPFEKNCAASLHPEVLNLGLFERGTIGEISRLAVPAYFRRRKADLDSPIGELSETDPVGEVDKRRFPLIALGLYMAAASIGIHAGLAGVFAMMEPRLARHLTRFGIHFQQIGDLVDYHGPRAAFYINRNMLLQSLRPDVMSMLNYVQADLNMAIAH